MAAISTEGVIWFSVARAEDSNRASDDEFKAAREAVLRERRRIGLDGEVDRERVERACFGYAVRSRRHAATNSRCHGWCSLQCTQIRLAVDRILAPTFKSRSRMVPH